MKKIVLFLVFLPFVSFGSFVYNDDITVDRMRFIKWASFGVSENAPRSFTVLPNSISDLRSSLMNSTFGLSFDTRSGVIQKLIVPSSSSASFFVQGSYDKATITNSVYVVSNGVGYVVSPMFFPELSSIYYSVLSLYINGYRGSGVVDDFSSSAIHCINVNYPLLLSDVLSSTNTVFRQILFNYLSTISANVQNINLNVEGLQSAIGESNEHLDNIQGSVSSLVEPVLGIEHSSNIAAENSNNLLLLNPIDENVSSINSNLASFASSSAGFSLTNNLLLSSTTNILASSTNALAGIASAISQNTDAVNTGNYTTHSQLGDLLGAYGEVNFASIDPNSAWVLSHLATDTPLDPADMPNFGTSNDDRGPRDSQQLRALEELSREDLKRAIDAIRDPDSPWHDKPLQDILNNRDARAEISGNFNVTRNFTTNQVLRPLTNSIKQASHDIQTNTTQQLENLFDKMSTDGINVRIIYPMHGKDSESVHVHDDALDVVANTFFEATNLLAAIADNPYDWDRFHDWDTNSFQFWQENIYTALTNNTREWLLLTDYEDFINSRRFEDIVNAFKGDHEDYFESLGIDLPENGNWWPVVTAAFLRQAIDINYVASMYTNVQAVIDMANNQGIFGEDEDSNSYNLSSATKKVIGSFPSRSAIDDYISQSTNSSNSVLSHTNDLVSSFSDITNLFTRSERFFSHGSGIPSSFTLFEIKAPGEGQQPKKFTVDVQEHENLFTLLRYGIASVFTFVNIILLPRFILWVFRLFMRLFRRSLPFIDAPQ